VKFQLRMPNFEGEAACADEDPELFFPIGNEGTTSGRIQVEQAKAVCRGCDVASMCLKYALDSGEDYGVWGGMSEEERRAVARRSAYTRRVG